MAALAGRATTRERRQGRLRSTSIDYEVSGYSQDEARERIAERRQARDAKELKYAIFGAGHQRADDPRHAQGQVQEADRGDRRAIPPGDGRQRAHGRPAGRPLGPRRGRHDDPARDGRQHARGAARVPRRRKEWELDEGRRRRGEEYVEEEERVLTQTDGGSRGGLRRLQRLKATPGDDPAAQQRRASGSSAGSATATRTSSATASNSTRSPTPRRRSGRPRSARRSRC